MTKVNENLELDLEVEAVSDLDDKSPTKKDLKKMEVVYADILRPTTVDLTGLEELSNTDKVAVLRISRFIDECREANRISSNEYVKVDKDEDIKELDCSDFESFGNLKSSNFYD